MTPPILFATIPALEMAAHDRRLNPFEKSALLWCYHTDQLNPVYFCPLKVETLRVGAGLRERTASDALQLLDKLGYLECGFENPAAPPEAREGVRPRWYRLVLRVPRQRAA